MATRDVRFHLSKREEEDSCGDSWKCKQAALLKTEKGVRMIHHVPKLPNVNFPMDASNSKKWNLIFDDIKQNRRQVVEELWTALEPEVQNRRHLGEALRLHFVSELNTVLIAKSLRQKSEINTEIARVAILRQEITFHSITFEEILTKVTLLTSRITNQSKQGASKNPRELMKGCRQAVDALIVATERLLKERQTIIKDSAETAEIQEVASQQVEDLQKLITTMNQQSEKIDSLQDEIGSVKQENKDNIKELFAAFKEQIANERQEFRKVMAGEREQFWKDMEKEKERHSETKKALGASVDSQQGGLSKMIGILTDVVSELKELEINDEKIDELRTSVLNSGAND